MPVIFTTASGSGTTYGNPFLGPLDHTAQISVNLALLTNAEIDDHGYVKPGIPLTKAGILVAGSPAFVYGVTVEAIKVANDNLSGTISALGSQDIAVGTVGEVLQQMCADNLGRALTANELAGFDRAGSKLVLV